MLRFLSVLASLFVVFLVTDAGAQQTDVVVTRTRRIAAAQKQLAERLVAGAVEGRFVERLRASYVFFPTAPELPQAPVRTSSAVSPFAIGQLVKVRGRLDADGRLDVSGYTFVPPVLPAGPNETVRTASTDLLTALDRGIRSGAMGAGDRTMAGSSDTALVTKSSLRTIKAAYAEARAQNAPDAAIKAIVQQWAALRVSVLDAFPDSEEAKALFGFSDNYDPWRYDLIFRQTPAVVALSERGKTTSRCSGVLIAADLVLTAGHCFNGDHPMVPTDLQVWFHYAKAPDGTTALPVKREIESLIAPAMARLPDMMAGLFGASLLDYAVVKLKAVEGEATVPVTAKPQCLRIRMVSKGEPLYVMGYPRGDPVMVHDSARVYLPFMIFDGDQFNQLRLNVDADLLDDPGRAALMSEFDSSYEPGPGPVHGLPMRFLYPVKDGGQPRLGIISDTFKGDSGGPVFDRERQQCVVGILLGGAPDTGKRLVATWKVHERVLPMSAIIDDLRKVAPEVLAQVVFEP